MHPKISYSRNQGKIVKANEKVSRNQGSLDDTGCIGIKKEIIWIIFTNQFSNGATKIGSKAGEFRSQAEPLVDAFEKVVRETHRW